MMQLLSQPMKPLGIALLINIIIIIHDYLIIFTQIV